MVNRRKYFSDLSGLEQLVNRDENHRGGEEDLDAACGAKQSADNKSLRHTHHSIGRIDNRDQPDGFALTSCLALFFGPHR